MTHLLLLVPTLLLAQGLSFDGLLRQIGPMPPAQRTAHVETFLAGRALPLVESDTLLTFVWYGVADSVFVNGALQDGWSKPARMDQIRCAATESGPSIFYKRYTVPRDARLEYQLVVNGRSMLDPGNVRRTANGDFSNSEAVMPGFVATHWTAVRAEVPHGTLDTLLFTPRDTTLRARRVIVYVPPGVSRVDHARTPAKQPGDIVSADLPSIYIHDGESALRYMAVTTILENMLAARELPPVVAVFVPPVERSAEYAGAKLTPFINALADELVPMIEQRYPVAPVSAKRGTMGISHGGHVAIAAGLARPDVFGLCSGQSPTITPILSVLLDVRKRSAPFPSGFRLYQQCGLFDIVSEQYRFLTLNREFSRQVDALPIQHLYAETSDGHDWPSWRERVPEILRFFFMH
ncbi:MAG: putative esterase [Bacteroidetes bacterium]|jgi:enterochelin esterase family protein|nr:putative esterase [Bacteroidota bacterium]